MHLNRLFRLGEFCTVPDGTDVSPFLNPGDASSGIPFDLLDRVSVTGGRIREGLSSRIHVHRFVSQLTFVLRGTVAIHMKDSDGIARYTVPISPNEAVLTPSGSFFQLDNANGSEPCEVLYIVTPAFLHEVSESGVEYSDALVLDADWDELESMDWQPPQLDDPAFGPEARQRSLERMAARRLK